MYIEKDRTIKITIRVMKFILIFFYNLSLRKMHFEYLGIGIRVAEAMKK